MIPTEPQPDQRATAWGGHVSVYETVFEPFSLQFAAAAIETLRLSPAQQVVDVGAGCGGAALAMAGRGAAVTAVDASAAMCDRIEERATLSGLPLVARQMDGQTLEFADATFDAALSVFGVILFPDAIRGLAEMRRVVRPGGRVAVVTWTEPDKYELATELNAAIREVRGLPSAGTLPAQLRFKEYSDFETLFRLAGFGEVAISARDATLAAPSARWLAERLAFAPGMAATVAAMGDAATAIRAQFVANLEAKHGAGPIRLRGRAFVGSALVAPVL